MLKRYLLAPGPTPVPSEVLLAMAMPIIHHRSPDFLPVLDSAKRDFSGYIRQKMMCLFFAQRVQAEWLVLLITSSTKVALYFGKPDQRWLDRLTLAEAKRYLAEGHFAKGSMGPKIEAIVWYLDHGGGEALITNPDNLEAALAGRTGTRVTRD